MIGNEDGDQEDVLSHVGQNIAGSGGAEKPISGPSQNDLKGELFASLLAAFRRKVEKLMPESPTEREAAMKRRAGRWSGEERGAVLKEWWQHAEPREAEQFRADLLWAASYFGSLSGAVTEAIKHRPPVLRMIREAEAERARARGRPDLARLRLMLSEEFWNYDARRPEVYRALKEMALALRKEGQRHASTNDLLSRIRERGIRHNAERFTRSYALKLMAEEPELAGMFKVTKPRNQESGTQS